MVGLAGLEPATPDLEGRCSIQLSYNPMNKPMVRIEGIEPPTISLGRSRSIQLSYTRISGKGTRDLGSPSADAALR